MLTDYEKIERGFFRLDMVDDNGQRLKSESPISGHLVPLHTVEPFIEHVRREGFGDHESIMVGYRFDNGDESNLFVIGKTIRAVDGWVTIEHWNYHERRKTIVKSHEVRRFNPALAKVGTVFTAFYDELFKVVDEDIPATLKALIRLYATREVWQEYDCPDGCDFDLHGDDMVHLGSKIQCSFCGEEHTVDEELQLSNYERVGNQTSFYTTPKDAAALERWKKNT